MRVVAVLLAVIGGAAGTAASAAPVARKAPATWDPRVRSLVRFVERERKLDFDHPIPVEFLDDAAFIDALAVDQTADDTKHDRLYAGDLYALGLVGPDVDLSAAVEALDAAGVSGFYDNETKEMKIRGQKLDDVIVRATVVHELTHALQDQTFDFQKMQRRAKSSGADFADDALIEGDATWVEEAYIATLPARQQDEYDAQYDVSSESGATPEAASAPAPAIDLLLSTPYTLGYAFADYLRLSGGSGAVDRAFRDPPPSDEQVVDPVAFLRDELPAPPAKPKLATGEDRRGGADEIGVVQLYFMLAARLDARVALVAVTGWKGDAYIGYSRGDVPCIRAAIRTDDATEARELTDALRTWGDHGAADAMAVARRGSVVELDACGAADAPIPTEAVLLDASDVLSARYLVYGGTEQASPGLTPTDVRCLTDLEVTDSKFRDLLFAADLTPAEQRRLDRRTGELAARCDLVSTG